MSEENERYLVRAEEMEAHAISASHPWNPHSSFSGVRLANLTGLSRAGVSLMRVPAGKESFIYHAQWREEEWIYIISGHGAAEIEDEEFDVGPGDFMGFPAGVAHHLRNPNSEDLVYLVGGENVDLEVADFPRLGRRMLRHGQNVEIFRVSEAESFGPLQEEDAE